MLRRSHGLSRMSRKPSITICPARVPVSVEFCPEASKASAKIVPASGEARLTDLAAHLGVSAATASKVVHRLQVAGLLESRPYRSILLTERGQAVAAASRHRHAIVREFLSAIGVSESTSEADAEGMEHHVSDETLAALVRTTRMLKPK